MQLLHITYHSRDSKYMKRVLFIIERYVESNGHGHSLPVARYIPSDDVEHFIVISFACDFEGHCACADFTIFIGHIVNAVGESRITQLLNKKNIVTF